MKTFIIFCIIIIMMLSIVLSWINLPGNFIFLSLIFVMGLLEIIDPLSNFYYLLFFIIFLMLEIIEFLLSALVVKFYGGTATSSYLSILGAIIGTIIGTLLLPIIGSIIGLILGSYIVVYYNEKNSGKNTKDAINIANSVIISYIITKGSKSIGVLWLSWIVIQLNI